MTYTRSALKLRAKDGSDPGKSGRFAAPAARVVTRAAGASGSLPSSFSRGEARREGRSSPSSGSAGAGASGHPSAPTTVSIPSGRSATKSAAARRRACHSSASVASGSTRSRFARMVSWKRQGPAGRRRPNAACGAGLRRPGARRPPQSRPRPARAGPPAGRRASSLRRPTAPVTATGRVGMDGEVNARQRRRASRRAAIGERRPRTVSSQRRAIGSAAERSSRSISAAGSTVRELLGELLQALRGGQDADRDRGQHEQLERPQPGVPHGQPDQRRDRGGGADAEDRPRRRIRPDEGDLAAPNLGDGGAEVPDVPRLRAFPSWPVARRQETPSWRRASRARLPSAGRRARASGARAGRPP